MDVLSLVKVPINLIYLGTLDTVCKFFTKTSTLLINLYHISHGKIKIKQGHLVTTRPFFYLIEIKGALWIFSLQFLK